MDSILGTVQNMGWGENGQNLNRTEDSMKTDGPKEEKNSLQYESQFPQKLNRPQNIL